MEAGGPGSAVAEKQQNAETTQAHRAAEKLVRQRTKDISTKIAKSGVTIDQLPPGEKVLHSADLLRTGIGDDYGAGIAVSEINANPADDMLSIKTQEGAPDIVVSKITGEKRSADGTLTLICETPTGGVEEVPADKFLAAHAEKNAGAIASVFSGDQAKLVEWHASGADTDSPVSADQIAAFDTVDAPRKEQGSQTGIDIFIGQQIDSLIMQIEGMEKTDPKREQLTALLKDLQLATFKRGPVGALYKQDALRKLAMQRVSEGEVGAALVAQIDQQIDALHDSGAIASAEDALIAFLDEKMPEENATRREELVDRVYKGEGVAVLQQEDVAKLDGINELNFGDTAVTDKIVESLISNPNVDDATKQELKAKWKKGAKITGFSLLAILLALPAAAIGIAFATTQGLGGHQ